MDSGTTKRPSAALCYQRRVVLINEALDRALPSRSTEPRGLHEAMWHAVFGGGGGKRLRPVIVLSVATDFGRPPEVALPAAVALELTHDYSLVHDDLPCMDDAQLRRGAPSVHAAHGYADALLVGDALLTLAFEVLARGEPPNLVGLVAGLAGAAGAAGMIAGQHADLDPTGEIARRLPGREPPELRIHRLKTGCLFEFAFLAGGLVAERPAGDLDRLAAAGAGFGLAFQIADDIRDAEDDVTAPNVARTLGVDRARELAQSRLGQCVDHLSALVGPDSLTVELVRAASVEMGLEPSRR